MIDTSGHAEIDDKGRPIVPDRYSFDSDQELGEVKKESSDGWLPNKPLAKWSYIDRISYYYYLYKSRFGVHQTVTDSQFLKAKKRLKDFCEEYQTITDIFGFVNYIEWCFNKKSIESLQFHFFIGANMYTDWSNHAQLETKEIENTTVNTTFVNDGELKDGITVHSSNTVQSIRELCQTCKGDGEQSKFYKRMEDIPTSLLYGDKVAIMDDFIVEEGPDGKDIIIEGFKVAWICPSCTPKMLATIEAQGKWRKKL
ncbi:hypothetical protein LCGC14_1122600 [marine sediment metagenome]|uniref:Uncharacterized protein n=1 Tax=marine sediment metagenome TaxID=412755 RepID=A0A0F9PLR1_9ZZZZ